MDHNEKLSKDAIAFIKENKNLLYDQFANGDTFTSRTQPITVFMAGIPGAGKTEVVSNMLSEWKTPMVHIDADAIRELFRDIGYDGENAHLFQRAASHGVDKLFDYVQHKKYHAVIDGTFASYNSIKNVRRALGRGRKVIIYFIYQDPVIAWKITQGREKEIGRRVPREDFINAYFTSRENIKKIREEHGEAIELNLIIKNVQSKLGKQRNNISDIDSYLPDAYTRGELEKIIW